MAEAALFTVASKILSTLAGPGFQMAYEKACSIRNATDELKKLKTSITTIQAVLLDAEKRKSDSEALKIWMKRVKDVLYEADDLFDEVDADYRLRQHMKGNKVSKTVRVSCSWLNPILSKNSIAIQVKSIRESLLAISKDMKMFQFALSQVDKPINGMREGEEPGNFVDSKSVIGRDKDKEVILKMLLHESKKDVWVIAVVGIGGMGKTTLTQLIYNDKKIEMNFEKRWFACISDSTSDSEVFGKILQSMGGNCNDKFNASILQNKIRESIEGKKFLLVLDDVWDDNFNKWQERMSFLSTGGKGSKIIVSTRSEAVAKAVGGIKEDARVASAVEIHNLHGLSEEDSWNLFKRICLTPVQEKDPTRIRLGKDIIKKCANVPLAIKSIASLLLEMNAIKDWEFISDEELPRLGRTYKDSIMPVLKLSYEYLRSDLKHCFAYCSLFPKDYEFCEIELVNLWIAQGYVSQSNEKHAIEDIGRSYLMELCRRSLFQVDEKEYGVRYKMHDLIHDLAIHVSGDEISLLSNTSSSSEVIGIRHAGVDFDVDGSCVDLLGSFLRANRLRSLLFMTPSQPIVDFSDCKYLRALKVVRLGMENLPSCIGELKHLRYLDISFNNFKEFPDSITKLVNLCTLNIKNCRKLELLPSSFGKLVSLRHLYIDGCVMLKHMPAGFEKLTRLQSLHDFRVSKNKNEGHTFRLDGLSQLKIRGALNIRFDDGVDDWDGMDCWQPPLFLEELRLYDYKGVRIPKMENGRAAKLTSLFFVECTRVKCLPSLKCLANIKNVELYDLDELEYIEEEEGSIFVPDLERLKLDNLSKLEAWSRKECSKSTFSRLTHLIIIGCWKLISLPLCPSIEHLQLNYMSWEQIEELKLLQNSLVHVSIHCGREMVIFPGKSLTSLRHLEICYCKELKKVELPPLDLNNLEELDLNGSCSNLELWEDNKRGVEWDSLSKLSQLKLDSEKVPSPEMLPDCLRRLQQLGKLEIIRK